MYSIGNYVHFNMFTICSSQVNLNHFLIILFIFSTNLPFSSKKKFVNQGAGKYIVAPTVPTPTYQLNCRSKVLFLVTQTGFNRIGQQQSIEAQAWLLNYPIL